jgi:feruloyl esterase
MKVTVRQGSHPGFYGSMPLRSYWNGCPTGGRQGLKEAQKFPMTMAGSSRALPRIVRPSPCGLPSRFAETSQLYSSYQISTHPPGCAGCLRRARRAEGRLIESRALQLRSPCAVVQGDGWASLPHCGASGCRQEDLHTRNQSPHRRGVVSFSGARQRAGVGYHGQRTDPYTNIWTSTRYVVFKNPSWDWRTFNFDSDFTRAEEPKMSS